MPKYDPFKNRAKRGYLDLSMKDTNRAGTDGDLLRDFFDADVKGYSDRAITASGMPTEIENGQGWKGHIEERLNAPDRVNPYSLDVGNQGREGYAAALEQLNNGTSTIAGQTSQAMNQMGNQVAEATAGGGGLSQALASRVGAGGLGDLAGQAGSSRLKEFMEQQNQYGQGLGNMRGQDNLQQGASNDAMLKQRAQDDALTTFYGTMGADLDKRQKTLGLRNAKLHKRTELAKAAKNMANIKGVVDGVATVAKTVA